MNVEKGAEKINPNDIENLSETKNCILKDLYILLETGECLVPCVSLKDVNPELFSALLSAILKFSKEIKGDEVSGFTFKSEKICCIKKDGIITAARCSKHLPDNIIHAILDSILRIFLTEYGAYIPSWTGNLDIFNELKEDLKKILTSCDIRKLLETYRNIVNANEILVIEYSNGNCIYETKQSDVDAKQRKSLLSMMYSIAKKLCECFKVDSVELIVTRGKNKWICMSIFDKYILLSAFSHKLSKKSSYIVNLTDLVLKLLVLMMVNQSGGS